MPHVKITRRVLFLGGMAALPGCSTIAAFNDASSPLPTYDLRPASGSTQGPRRPGSFLVATPVAPAILNTDRILVRPDGSAVTYLPEARFSDELPSLLQSLIVRSISSTQRVGYAGPANGGPIPDFAVLSRIDSFEVSFATAAEGSETISIVIDIEITVVRDSDQVVVATRRFDSVIATNDTSASMVIAAMQTALNSLLPEMANWVIAVSG